MNLKNLIYVPVVSMGLLASCSVPECEHNSVNESVKQVSVNGIDGTFNVIRHVTVALAPDEDIVEYVYGGKKRELFRGYRGKSLNLSFDESSKILIIEYCDGSVIGNMTSFLHKDELSQAGYTLYRTQVINNRGFTFNGKPLCE